MRHGAESLTLEGSAGSAPRADLALAWGPAGRTRTLNGKAASLARHLSVLPVVSWTAADGEVVAGAPGARRRLLDQGVVGTRPAAIEGLARYRRALDQKRELLARGGRGLGSWNEVLASAAAELIRARGAYAERLGRAVSAVLDELDGDLPPVALRYRPSPAGSGGDPGATLKALEEARGREVERRRPLVGPHRDELEIEWGGRGARRVASAGESKLLGLALAAARGRILAGLGRPPIYLLDDVDSELDGARLEAAWKAFAGAEQVFASSHREDLGGRLGAAFECRLEAGKAAF